MIVAITGATGAIGKRLLEQHLAAGDTVRALSRRERARLPSVVQVHRGDLASENDVLARFADGADVLYHCAAEIFDAARMMAVNAEGTRNLVSAAAGRVGRWVQLSSIAVYGAPERGVIDEATPLAPIDVYGESKAQAERAVLDAAEHGSFSCAVIRPSKVFGAGVASGNNQVLYRLFSLVDQRLFFFIGKPGALTHYVHAANLVAALVRAGRATLAGTRLYNLSDDRTIEYFVDVIADALGEPAPRLRLPEAPVRLAARVLGRLPGFPLDERRVAALVNRAAFPSERIRQDLGYAPVVALEQGLRDLVLEWRGRGTGARPQHRGA